MAPSAEQLCMVESEASMLCAECLEDAAIEGGRRINLRLAAAGLARDLADSGSAGFTGLELFEAEYAAAIGRTDASDLDSDSFASALRRFACLRGALLEGLATMPGDRAAWWSARWRMP